MAGNRKKAEALILERIDAILPGSENKQFWADRFAGMSDTQFDTFIADLESRKQRLAIVAPNQQLNGPKLEIPRNLALGKKWGHNFFQKILIDNGVDAPYWSNVPYLVVLLTLRRQAQLAEKKISVPEDNKSVDDLTGQATGKSKGSKISYPEMQVLSALQLTAAQKELLKYRGGDVEGFNAMNTMIARTGAVSMAALDELGTSVRSTETFSAYLTGMHLSNTL